MPYIARKWTIAIWTRWGLWAFPLMPAILFGFYKLWPSADALTLACSLVLLIMILAITLIDARHMIIPDTLVFCLGITGVVSISFLTPGLVVMHLLGSIGGFAIFFVFRKAFFQLRGKEGIGFGDVKLVAVGCLWIGIEGLPSQILFASSTALVLAVFLRAKRGRLSRIPFAPHLTSALWIVWCCGPLVLDF